MDEPKLHHRYWRTEVKMNRSFKLTRTRTIVIFMGTVIESPMLSPYMKRPVYVFKPVNNPGWMPRDWKVPKEDYPLYNRQREAKPGDIILITYQYKELPSRSSLRKAFKQKKR